VVHNGIIDQWEGSHPSGLEAPKSSATTRIIVSGLVEIVIVVWNIAVVTVVTSVVEYY